ncbi:helix-turn-helix transcriptional regulator [Nioella ostreopsis]|uniref:helix-turn-helix transcriptional regulator n=1 Tax=Nioella ostreopsis TaxID=2448479 RepID=UPI0013DEA70B|nr:WYL domain-containing protein [Nioella ostreopsis]
MENKLDLRVALKKGAGHLDRIVSARPVTDSFACDPAFDLTTHSARAFGSFHTDAEYGEVVWRFAPAAAPTAREFLFHPTQEMTEGEDGSLTVRFTASGHLEMAWHLYMWGDAVEVLAPTALRDGRPAQARRLPGAALTGEVRPTAPFIEGQSPSSHKNHGQRPSNTRPDAGRPTFNMGRQGSRVRIVLPQRP